jgi:hypothetical protein
MREWCATNGAANKTAALRTAKLKDITKHTNVFSYPAIFISVRGLAFGEGVVIKVMYLTWVMRDEAYEW